MRQAKRAKLAVRRFLRQRLKQGEGEIAEKLAQNNAAVFSKVATSLMGEDIETGSTKMRAGILCFDEININDPFTAIALKGQILLSTHRLVICASALLVQQAVPSSKRAVIGLVQREGCCSLVCRTCSAS